MSLSSSIKVTQVIALVSMALSATVILTVLLFPSMRRKKVFVPIIAMISLCDILGNFPYAMAVCPINGGTLCQFQGFSNLYFFPVSWMYSTALAYLLRGVFFQKRVILSESWIHFPCWTIPLTLTLLILTTNTYGWAGAPSCICTIAGNRTGIIWWHSITYYGLLLACSGAMLYWSFQLLFEIYIFKTSAQDSKSKQMGTVLVQYPLVMVALWLPYVVAVLEDFTTDDFPSYYDTFYDVAELLKIMHGGVTAAIFFVNSNEARQRWYRLLCFCSDQRDIAGDECDDNI